MSALFIGVRSTGLSYSDSSRQRDGDYVRLGTDLPPFAWSSKLVKAGKTYERYHAEETRAESWLAANLKLRKRIKVATVLRASTSGINAWKFFLHRIIK